MVEKLIEKLNSPVTKQAPSPPDLRHFRHPVLGPQEARPRQEEADDTWAEAGGANKVGGTAC